MRALILLGLATSVLLPLAACSSTTTGTPDGGQGSDSGTTGDAGANDTEPSKGCKDYGAAYCAALQACSAFTVESIYGDVATCSASKAAACHSTSLYKGQNLAAPACASGMAQLSCNDLLLGRLAPGCEGGQADGDVCRHNEQCKSGFCSVLQGSGSCSKCAPVTEGASCGSRDECAPWFSCQANTACKAYAKAGESCAARDCGPDSECLNQTCVALLKAGATCGLDGGARCDTGLDCTNGKCTAIPFVADGERPLDQANERRLACRGMAKQDANTVCAADGKPGKPCTGGTTCIANYFCDGVNGSICAVGVAEQPTCP